MCSVADNIQQILCESMKHWKTELRSGTEKLATVMIKRGIFQGTTNSKGDKTIRVDTTYPYTQEREGGALLRKW